MSSIPNEKSLVSGNDRDFVVYGVMSYDMPVSVACQYNPMDSLSQGVAHDAEIWIRLGGFGDRLVAV